jgi:hypothetical protein
MPKSHQGGLGIILVQSSLADLEDEPSRGAPAETVHRHIVTCFPQRQATSASDARAVDVSDHDIFVDGDHPGRGGLGLHHLRERIQQIGPAARRRAVVPREYRVGA